MSSVSTYTEIQKKYIKMLFSSLSFYLFVNISIYQIYIFIYLKFLQLSLLQFLKLYIKTNMFYYTKKYGVPLTILF